MLHRKQKKQKVVALSSVEAEFRSIAKGITEIIWLKKLLSELDFPQKKAWKLFCDNKVVISISGNPVQHDRTKHVEIDRHFIKKKLESMIISLAFVRSRSTGRYTCKGQKLLLQKLLNKHCAS